MTEPQLVKVRLTNQGADAESPWAHDLGPGSGRDGARVVRLANVPFLHAKPTWGDVIEVVPADDGVLTWDRAGVPWSSIGSRIVEDGGRWAMIVDYDGGDDAFAAIAQVCAANDVVCEGAWPPRGADPGRVYLAVRQDVGDAVVMKLLRDAKLPCELLQVHPEPIEVLAPSAPSAPARLATIPGAIDPAAAKLPAVPAHAPKLPRAATAPPTPASGVPKVTAPVPPVPAAASNARRTAPKVIPAAPKVAPAAPTAKGKAADGKAADGKAGAAKAAAGKAAEAKAAAAKARPVAAKAKPGVAKSVVAKAKAVVSKAKAVAAKATAAKAAPAPAKSTPKGRPAAAKRTTATRPAAKRR